MSFITPPQFRRGLEETKEYVDSKVVVSGGSGAIPTYIVGSTPFASSWLSLMEGGAALSPVTNATYIIMSQGEYLRKMYMWNGNEYVSAAQKVNVYYTDSTNVLDDRTLTLDRGYNGVVSEVTTSKYCVGATISIANNNTDGQNIGYGIYVSVNDGQETTYTAPNGASLPEKQIDIAGSGKIKVRIARGASLGIISVSITLNITEYLKVPTETDEYLPVNSYSNTTNGQSGLVPSVSSDTTAEALTPKGWDEIDFNVTPEEIRRMFLSIGGGARQGDGNPIGTILSYMGKTAPYGYLICDGTSYNITDYQNLADFFEVQFGTKNYFGGDGDDTFAVPDLRGEFLRGSGINGRSNQGDGEEVGVHQDGTEHTNVIGWNNDAGQSCIAIDLKSLDDSFATTLAKADKTYSTSQRYYTQTTPGNRATQEGSNGSYAYTSRPTNTSVLYIIKY